MLGNVLSINFEINFVVCNISSFLKLTPIVKIYNIITHSVSC